MKEVKYGSREKPLITISESSYAAGYSTAAHAMEVARSARVVLGGAIMASILVALTIGKCATNDPTTQQVADADPAAQVQQSSQSQRYWYGWQVALAGESGAGLLATAQATHNMTSALPWRALLLYPVGLPLYLFGGPLVHMSNGNMGKGLISLGMNVSIPLTAGFVAEALACTGAQATFSCHRDTFFRWTAVTILVTPIIDAALLAWGEVPIERTLTTSAWSRYSLRPFVAHTESSQTIVGLTGAF